MVLDLRHKSSCFYDILILAQNFCLGNCYLCLLIFQGSHSNKRITSSLGISCTKLFFLLPQIPLSWNFLLLSSNTWWTILCFDNFMFNDLLWFAYHFFTCVSPNSFAISGFATIFSHVIVAIYKMFLGGNFCSRDRCFGWYNCIFGCSGLLV